MTCGVFPEPGIPGEVKGSYVLKAPAFISKLRMTKEE